MQKFPYIVIFISMYKSMFNFGAQKIVYQRATTSIYVTIIYWFITIKFKYVLKLYNCFAKINTLEVSSLYNNNNIINKYYFYY